MYGFRYLPSTIARISGAYRTQIFQLLNTYLKLCLDCQWEFFLLQFCYFQDQACKIVMSPPEKLVGAEQIFHNGLMTKVPAESFHGEVVRGEAMGTGSTASSSVTTCVYQSKWIMLKVRMILILGIQECHSIGHNLNCFHKYSF